MTNEEKLEVLKQFLTEKGIAFRENHVSKACGVTIRLKTFKPRVAVNLGDDQEFYSKTKWLYNPFFIRDEETAERVVEKFEGLLQKRIEAKQRREEKAKRREIYNHFVEAKRRREEEKKRLAEEKLKNAPKKKRARIPIYKHV